VEAGKKGAGQTSSDRQFVMQAARNSLFEVKMGQMALEHAVTPEVKKYAARVVEDHQRLNKELAALIGRPNLSLPEKVDRKTQERTELLGQVKGIDFDRTYLEQMVKSHARAVELFEAQARDGQDADLKAFAARVLPAWKDHLKRARALTAKVKPAR